MFCFSGRVRRRKEKISTHFYRNCRYTQIELKRADEELEMQRIKFSGIYDLIPAGYFILDNAGVIEEVNSAGIGLLKTGRVKIISKRLQNFIAPDHTDNYYRFFRQMLGSNVPQSSQLKFISGAAMNFMPR